MSGVLSKNVNHEDKYILTLLNFSTWMKHWDEVEIAQYGSLLGTACESGIRPDFKLEPKTSYVIEEVRLRDGTMGTMERDWGPQDDQNRRILLAEKVAEKKRFLEGEGKAYTAIMKTISAPVIAKIKSKYMDEYMQAVRNVDVVKLIGLIRTVCQLAMRAYAPDLREDWEKHTLNTSKTSVEEWYVEYNEKLTLFEQAVESKVANTERIATLKKQLAGEWYKWKGTACKPIAEREPNDPNIPECEEIIRNMMIYDNQEFASARKSSGKQVDDPRKNRNFGKRNRVHVEEETPTKQQQVGAFRVAGQETVDWSKVGGRTNKGELICYNCLQSGHPTSKCTKPKNTCATCKGMGHHTKMHEPWTKMKERYAAYGAGRREHEGNNPAQEVNPVRVKKGSAKRVKMQDEDDRDADSESMIFGDFVHSDRSARATVLKKSGGKSGKGSSSGNSPAPVAAPSKVEELRQVAKAGIKGKLTQDKGRLLRNPEHEESEDSEELEESEDDFEEVDAEEYQESVSRRTPARKCNATSAGARLSYASAVKTPARKISAKTPRTAGTLASVSENYEDPEADKERKEPPKPILASLPSDAKFAELYEHADKHNKFRKVVYNQVAYLYKQESDGYWHMYGTRDEIPLSNKVFPWKQAPNKTLPTGINKTPAEHAADQARKAAGKKSDGQSVQTSVTPKKGQGVQEDLHELPADRIIGAELRRGVLDTHVVFQEMFQEPDEEYEYDMEALDVDPLPILTIHTTAKSEKFKQDASKALKRKNVFLAAEWLKTWAKHHHSCSKASTVLKQLSQLKINPDIDIVTAHEICVRAARFMMPDLARADRELIRALLNHRTDWHELRTERSLYDTNLAYRDLKTLFVPTQKKFKEEPEDTDYMVSAKEVIAEDKETYPKGKGRPFGKSRIALVLHNAMYEEGSMSTPVKGPSCTLVTTVKRKVWKMTRMMKLYPA